MGRNAGYLGNPNLKPEGQTVNFTKEQIEEYIKCAKDPVYFIQKYIKVVSLDKGLVPFHLFDYQEDMINKIHDNRFIIAIFHDNPIKRLQLLRICYIIFCLIKV